MDWLFTAQERFWFAESADQSGVGIKMKPRQKPLQLIKSLALM